MIQYDGVSYRKNKKPSVRVSPFDTNRSGCGKALRESLQVYRKEMNGSRLKGRQMSYMRDSIKDLKVCVKSVVGELQSNAAD